MFSSYPMRMSQNQRSFPEGVFRLTGFFPEAFEEIFFSLMFQAALHDMLPGVFVQLVDGNGGIFGSQPVPDAGVILHDSQGPLHHLTGNQLAMKALCRNGAFVSCGNDNPKRFGPFQIDAPMGAVGRFQNQRFPAPPPGGGVTVFIFKSPFHCYQVGHFFILLHNQGHAAVVGGKTLIDQGAA